MQSKEFPPRPYYLQVHPTGFLLYPERHQKFSGNDSSLKNLQSGREVHKSKNLSIASRRRLKRITYNWLASIAIHNGNYQNETGRKGRFVPIFITLTLPSEQIHGDNEIKRECLNSFLIQAQRRFKWINIIWKAELQKNGNIHFHVIADRYAHWKPVRELWNNCLEKLGYITRFEEKHRHRTPPSTQVEAPRDLKAIGTYCTKYISKPSSDSREVEGRLWGCTDALRDITYPDILAGAGVKGMEHVQEEYSEFIRKLEAAGLIEKWIDIAPGTVFMVPKGDSLDLLRTFAPRIYEEVKRQYLALFADLYAAHLPRYHPPKQLFDHT